MGASKIGSTVGTMVETGASYGGCEEIKKEIAIQQGRLEQRTKSCLRGDCLHGESERRK